MLTLDPNNTSTVDLHSYMLSAVAPRPIAFASTISDEGIPNLAPFSFFNAFSSNPPILVFSANRRVRDDSSKDTYANIKATNEVVINVVSYSFVRKMALSSIEYPKETDEFKKAGFTQLASERIKPFRVAESPVHFECKVNDIIELGQAGGAGNLFICEILLMHVSEDVLDKNGKIDQQKIDLCARMGGRRYCRASGDAIFEIHQPVNKLAIGFDQLPESIKTSKVLRGNDLAILAGVEHLPSQQDIDSFKNDPRYIDLLQRFQNDNESLDWHIHDLAKRLVRTGDVESAWKILLQRVAKAPM